MKFVILIDSEGSSRQCTTTRVIARYEATPDRKVSALLGMAASYQSQWMLLFFGSKE